MTSCRLCGRLDELRVGDDGWVVCQPCVKELRIEGYRRHDAAPVRVRGLFTDVPVVCLHGVAIGDDCFLCLLMRWAVET